MYEIVNQFPHEIFNDRREVSISLYQPTHRHRPSNKQDLIRFKNLIQKVEENLNGKFSRKQVSEIMEPFNNIADNKLFWNDTGEGLAIFSNGQRCIIYKLQREVEERVLISDSFYIKPLIRIFQSADRYQILGINRNEFDLYEGNRYGFEKIQLGEDVDRTIKDVLGDEYTQSHLNPGSYGGAKGSPMFHGHGGRKEEIGKDMEKFFRYIDRFVTDEFSKKSNLPLVLVALKEYHGEFKKISHNPYLLEEGVKKAYDSIDIKELKDEVWDVIECYYEKKTEEVVVRYNDSKSNFLCSDDYMQIGKASIENRVDTLIIEADKILSGKVNRETGEVNILEEGDLIDDILDEIAEIVIENKGKVIVLPREKMPTDKGIAAIYRF